MALILGFCGRVVDKDNNFICSAGAGKDTLGYMIIQKLKDIGADVVHTTFIHPLIKELSLKLGLPEKYFTTRKLKDTIIPEMGKSPRDLLVEESNKKRIKQGTDYLARTFLNYAASQENKIIVVTDVRRTAEAQAVRSSGVLTHVIRPVDNKKKYLETLGIKQVDPETEQYVQVQPGDIEFTNHTRPDGPDPLLIEDYVTLLGEKMRICPTQNPSMSP